MVESRWAFHKNGKNLRCVEKCYCTKDKGCCAKWSIIQKYQIKICVK